MPTDILIQRGIPASSCVAAPQGTNGAKVSVPQRQNPVDAPQITVEIRYDVAPAAAQVDIYGSNDGSNFYLVESYVDVANGVVHIINKRFAMFQTRVTALSAGSKVTDSYSI